MRTLLIFMVNLNDRYTKWYHSPKGQKAFRPSKHLADGFAFLITLVVSVCILGLIFFAFWTDDLFQYTGIPFFLFVIIVLISLVLIFGFVSVVFEIRNELIDLNKNIEIILTNQLK